MGDSPGEARKNGANVSGRVICVTTNFAEVVVHDCRTGKLSLRKRRGVSALNAAIRYLYNETDWVVVWVAWPGEIECAGEDAEEELQLQTADKEVIHKLLKEKWGENTKPVWLDPPYTQWREYPDQVLNPLFHYIPYFVDEDVLSLQTRSWKAYYQMNKAFAEKILEVYCPGDIIWIHETYFLLLPQMLRERLNDVCLGLFIRTPFPSSEFVRCLPQRKELLEGMLGASMVTFQSASYVDHFMSSCIRILDIEHKKHKLLVGGRYVLCAAIPGGVDVPFVEERSRSPEVKALVAELRKVYEGKKVIVGRDKMDSVDSVLQKMRAYELFLQTYPDWRDQVILIQITTPVHNFPVKVERQLLTAISQINSTYGSMSFAPVQHYSRHINQDEYFALLQIADVGLFTSIRESASHAAIEYIVCQSEASSPVILSELMGLTQLFSGATTVNPYDGLDVAYALDKCLKAPKKKELFKAASRLNVHDSNQLFLSTLLKHDLKRESKHLTYVLDASELTISYHNSTKRLFLFDYDGTLTHIVKNPADAIPSTRMRKILTKLCADERNEIWIISGRDRKFLDHWFLDYRVSLSAEHGCYVRRAGEHEWCDLAAQEDNSWRQIVIEVLQAYTERTQGSVIEVKDAAITWHYRRADPVFGAFQAAHLRAYLERTVAVTYPVNIISGKANLEIRPKLFNKGNIIQKMFQQSKDLPDFVLCMGDDTTDEDMFLVVNEWDEHHRYFTCLVGPAFKLTTARYHVSTVDDVHDVLFALVQ